MKNKYLILALFLLISHSIEAQLFRPFTGFRVIRTEYFDIIFPRESEASARLLASYADNIYREMSSMLGIRLPERKRSVVRLPVTFAPHTDMFNGFYSIMPGSHIVLFDTHMDIEWTSFADNLKGLFIHELAHAISLNTRSPFWRGLHRIFGNWATPALWNAPPFMVEGVAISFESMEGGRANDPRIRQFLRQAIHEGKFLTPMQASGVYDIPLRESWYEYGGLFSAWLIENYGMEKYARLWQAMGGRSRFSPFVYRSGFYSIFTRVYGMGFLHAWDLFKASLALDGLEENDNELLPVRYRFFSERNSFIQGLIARGNSLFFYCLFERRIRVYDTLTGNLRSINTSHCYDFDVSADGTTLLLSGYRFTGQRAIAVVTEYCSDSGRRTGRRIEGLYRARYFRDGVIGIRSDLHNTNIVFEDFNGRSEILLRGSNELMFSGPQAVDNERIAFIAAHRGRRELWLYNYVTAELFRIEISADGDADGIDYWRYMRNLGVSSDKLFFSHNSDDRMYKLGVVDLEKMQAVFSGRDFSGGVFNPVSVNGSIYYLASFTGRDSLMRFPETITSLSGTQKEIKLTAIDIHSFQAITNLPYSGDCRRYFALRYMNPFHFWFPLPLFRAADSGGGISLAGGGIFSMMADPTGRNLVTIWAYADIPYKMARIELLSWQNTSLGFPLTLNFSDTVIESANITYRSTRASFNSGLFWSTGQRNHGVSLGGGYIRNADYTSGRSAYEWEESASRFFLSSGLSFSYRRSFNLRLTGISFADTFQPRAEGVLSVNAAARFPLGLTFFGAYDARGMDLHGISNTFGGTLITGYALAEYDRPGDLVLNWLAGAEASLGLFSFEIQRNLSHLYFNRFFGTLALRSQIYDSQSSAGAQGIALNDSLFLIQSLHLTLCLAAAIPFGMLILPLDFVIWGAWNFSNTITGENSAWNWGFGINIRL